MKNDHFFNRGKLIGSFFLAALIGTALEQFAGRSFGAVFGNALAVFLLVIVTLACRGLWMWVEGSNVTVSLWGKRRRLTVESLFVCAGALLAVSLMFSGLAWLAAPSSKGTKNYSRSSSSTAAEAQRAELQRKAAAEAQRVEDAHGAGWAGFNAALKRNAADMEKFNAWQR